MESVMNRIHSVRRSRLLRTGGCVALALTWLTSGQAAQAQAFQATPTIVSGTAGVGTGVNSTTINVFSGETVINWTPTDVAGTGTINFLPVGATATFIAAGSSGPPPSSYTVLNRVLPVDASGNPVARAIQFNGTLNARLADTTQGGDIWFYSPTGIIADKSATFSVGSLLLTTADVDTSGGLFGAGGTIRLTGPAASSSFINLTGATIDSKQAFRDTYVGVFAPRIEQGGTITVDGSAGLVAAEAGTITFSGGLVNFTVTQGTSDPNGIVHTGTTSGPSAQGTLDRQRYALVAMPKNTALTMLLSGTIGSPLASGAIVDGSAVELYAGYDPALPQESQVPGLGSISIGNTAFLSRAVISATNTIDIQPVADFTDPQNPVSGAVTFSSGGATLNGGIAVNLAVEDAESIFAGNSFLINSGVGGVGGTINLTAVGNNLPAAEAGSISSLFNTNLYAAGVGGFIAGPVPDAIGGTINIRVDGGILSIPSLDINASAQGATSVSAGGNAIGGTAFVHVLNNGSLSTSNLSLNADGSGGSSQSGGPGGAGTGGFARVLVESGGSVNSNSVDLRASGFGGQSFDAANGDAFGGRTSLELHGGSYNWNSLVQVALSFAGEAFTSTATSGKAQGNANAVQLTVDGGADLSVNSFVFLGADASTGMNGVAGYTANAGRVTANIGAGSSLTTLGDFDAHADAFLSREGFDANTVFATPDLLAGNVDIAATGGALSAGRFNISANTENSGAFITAGIGQAGSAQLRATGGGSITVSNPDAINLIEAVAFGSPGDAPSDAFGGVAQIIADNGTISLAGQTSVDATAVYSSFFSQLGTTGFNATGGFSGVELTAAGGSMTFDALTVSALGLAEADPNTDAGFYGDGGTGTGGSARIRAFAGTFDVNLATLVQANGIGGGSDDAYCDCSPEVPFQSGAGFGGFATVLVNGAAVTLGQLDVEADGRGGSFANTAIVPANGGAGQGGFATVSVNRGRLEVSGSGAVHVHADGAGGNGMDNLSPGLGGDGGAGTGGQARFLMDASGLGTFSAEWLAIHAVGIGGDAGVGSAGATGFGGAGFGGTAAFDVADGAFNINDFLNIWADGVGGLDAFPATVAVGGLANFLLVDSGTNAGLTRTIRSIGLSASGLETSDHESQVLNVSGTAGAVRISSQVGANSSALTVNGDLQAYATGGTPNIAAFSSSGNISVQAGNTALTSITGTMTFRAQRDVSFAVAPGARLNASVIDVTALGTITGTGVLSSTGNATLIGDLGINLTSLLSGGTTLLQALNGPVTVSTNLGSVGPVTVLGRSVDLVSTGALNFADADATAGNLSIRTAGNLDLATVDATGAVTLTSTNASMHSTGAVNGATISLSASNVILNDANVTSAGTLGIQAGGLYSLGGIARGTAVTIASSDVALSAAARIGVRGTTQTVALTNSASARPTFIGGTAQTGGYSLTNAEAQQVFADQRITLGVPNSATAPANLTLGDLTLSYGATGNVGSGGTIKVNTPGRVAVTGAVRLTTSSATDVFSIDPTGIDVVTDTGSISMLSSGGALQGRLDLIAGTIAVGSSAVLSQVGSASGLAAITALMNAPASTPSATGALQAGSINFQVNGGLYIQNSGATTSFADRRGFSANSVAITTSGPTSGIVINGRTFGAGGIAVTGLDTAKTISINGAPASAVGNFAALSSVNGCTIGRNCAVTINYAPDKPGITEPLSPGPGSGPSFLPLIEVDENDSFDSPPLIDEPITGVGNDDLWQSSCEGSEGCDKQGGNK